MCYPRNRVDFDPDDLSMPRNRSKYMIKHPGFRPATPAGIDGAPAPEAFWKTAPFAALLETCDGVQYLRFVRGRYVALTRQTVFNQAILLFR